MGKNHIIELNGKRYDALTGKIVSDTPHPATKAPKSPGKAMDGFTRTKPHAPRTVAGSSQGHHTEKSKTLMRHVVKKPAVTPVKSAKSAKPAAADIVAGHSIPRARAERAAHTPKSTMVKRFGLDVSSAPRAAVQQFKQTAAEVAAPLAGAMHAAGGVAIQATSPFADAIASATSHEQPKLKKTGLRKRIAKKLRLSSKAVNVTSALFAILLIGGFFAYQNLPRLSMKIAAARADVKGALPSYQPAGFHLSSTIKYKPGEVSVSYISNTDSERAYELTQAASEWDSESLRQNYVASANKPYQAVQEKGKTVYLLDESSATWVDAGVWYKIEGNSKLNSNQLLSIVNSL